MNKYERGLAALDELFANTTAEEFERDYLAAEYNIGTKVEDYLSRQCTELIICSEGKEQNSFNFRASYSSISSHSSTTYQVKFSSFSACTSLKACNDSMQGLAA